MADTKKIRVLYAEDREEIRADTAAEFGRAGFDVVVVENGQLALEALQRAKAAGEKFDVLVTDGAMPSLTGWDLLKTPEAQEVPVRILHSTEQLGKRLMDRLLPGAFDPGKLDPLHLALFVKQKHAEYLATRPVESAVVDLTDSAQRGIAATPAKEVVKAEVRMGHGDALNKLALNEKERVQRMLAKPLPRLADGYMDSRDLATAIQCFPQFMPAEVRHGKQWLSAMGIKENSPVPGRIFALDPHDRETPNMDNARRVVRRSALNELHELGCAAVPYSHPSRKEGHKRIEQYGIFLPYMKLSMDGKTVQRDLEGEAVFMAYLQDKGLVTQKDIDSAYETSTFRDKIKGDSVKLRAGWAAGH